MSWGHGYFQNQHQPLTIPGPGNNDKGNKAREVEFFSWASGLIPKDIILLNPVVSSLSLPANQNAPHFIFSASCFFYILP